ncbi:MAG: hypothetical protein U0840_08955 [Gemmataceae bacterium]
MFGFAWLTIRQAQEALRNGRLEEALRLVEQPAVRGHRKAGDLLTRIARAYVERGEQHLKRDDVTRAWADLLQAEQLGVAPRVADGLRKGLTRLGLAELRAVLHSGDLPRAEESVLKLRQRQVASGELGILEEGLRDWVRGRELQGKGEFALAEESLGQASRLLGVNSRLDQFRDTLRSQRDQFPELLCKLHEAAYEERWRDVVVLAEQVLAIAPQHDKARALRARAWRAIEPLTITQPGAALSVTKPDEANPADPLPPRFYLWIDSVGGYLVCLGNRLTFGQAAPDARVDVPLVADVSRLHATLSRDGEGYVLEAVRPIQVNGGSATRALLQPGDRVTIGASCQFLFRLPVPGSTSARLDLVSGHRLPTSVEGVILMAETLVLASEAQAHIQVPDLRDRLVLFRHRDGLGLRHSGEMTVNGQKSNGRSILPPRTTISGEDIGFAIEPA